MSNMVFNTEDDIRAVCNEIAEMLIEKNRSYGDSALSPLRCFSKSADHIEQLNVRMDDKLSRLLRGNGNNFNEDVEKDLMGYLVLKRVAVRRMGILKATEVGPVGDVENHERQPLHAPAAHVVEMSAASHTNRTYAQGQESEKVEDDVAGPARAVPPSAPTPGRFVKPTATTAKEMLAKEQSTRESYGEHH